MAQADQPDSYDEDLARIDASIAALKARDIAAAKERTVIASKIQAAQFQRDILAHANAQQKAKRAGKPRRVRRRPDHETAAPAQPQDWGTEPPPPPPGTTSTTLNPPPPPGSTPRTHQSPPPPPATTRTPQKPPPPPGANGGANPPPPDGHPVPPRASARTTPAQPPGARTSESSRHGGVGPGPARTRGAGTDGGTALVDGPPPMARTAPPPRRANFSSAEGHPPEASQQSVQNILLVLGALLIGVAAVVFAGVAVNNIAARATILAVATAVALASAPGIARSGLSSTAETIAGVGLVLLPMAIFALHGTALAGGPRVPAPLYLGITFALTSVASFGYAAVTGLSAPRYATVVATQPVPLLLAYPSIHSPAGWAAALTVVAVLDLLLLTTVIRRGRLVPSWPAGRPVATDPESQAAAEAGAADYARRNQPPTDPSAYAEDAPPRPEAAPEEPDLIITGLTGRPRRRLPGRLFPGPRPAGAPAAGPMPAAVPRSADWLRELTFALLCLASAGALLYATVALLQARFVPDALRSAVVLVLAAVTATWAARLLGNLTARNIAGAVLTLAVIGATTRVTGIVSPRWTLVLAAAAVAITGTVVGLLPEGIRRGPELAASTALTITGLFVGLAAIRAGFAPVQAARPIWRADTADYARHIAEAAGPYGWLLAFSALLLTIAAAVALPPGMRHEGAVVGVALTALAVPASLGLRWSEAPWPLVVAAVGIGGAGLAANTRRIAITHIAAAGAVGAFGAGAALSASWLTAAVLTALAGAGVMVAVAAHQIPIRLYAWLVGDWAAGAAALALPGAAVTGALAVADQGGGPPPTAAVTVPALAVGFLAVAATLSYAAVFQVARREISPPLTAGTGLGAVALALAALLAPGSTRPDIYVGALLLAAAGLLFFARSIDNSRRSDRVLDGPDLAAAAATVAICGALARVAALAFPHAPLAVAAVVVLVVSLGVGALPEDWKRGPVRGLAVSGLTVGVIAGYQVVSGAFGNLAVRGGLWDYDVSHFIANPPNGSWQAPFALAVIAVAATLAADRPWSYDISAVCGALAGIGVPWALGLPWWSPLLVGGAVALGYAVAAVIATDPRAAVDRGCAAAAVLAYAVVAGLVTPWSTGLALLLVVAIGLLVAGLARSPVPYAETELADQPPAAGLRTRIWAPSTAEVDLARDDTGMPRHRAQLGGAATGAVLFALPGVFASLVAGQHVSAGAGSQQAAEVILTAALAASSLGLALLALAGRYIPQYLPWATVGLVLGATVTAFVSIPTPPPTALYAASAALLGVLAELLRGATPAPGLTVARNRYAGAGRGAPRWTTRRPIGLSGRWLVNPATSAVVIALVPTVLAIFSIAPALKAALLDPLQQARHIWQGPVAALSTPHWGNVDATSVLAILLLTGAATLAAIGFGGKVSESIPVILPGLAITLLIAPLAWRLPFPAATTAGLAVFTIAMLGLALTPPPTGRASLLRATRNAVFVIGLLAGNAGLAGSLAQQRLTLFTLGSAVGVGLVAALAGRSQAARVLGWLFAAVMAQFFVLTVAIAAGLERSWAAFGVLGVGAVLLTLEATLPRLGLPQHRLEAMTVEWSGYASALLAGALAYDSPGHLAALLAAWGAVLGLAATRRGRRASQRRVLFWTSVGFEIVGWWMFIALAKVALPEAYTLPFAALALLIGVFEARIRPDLSSWAAYGPALVAAFVPTLGIVLAAGGEVREVLLLLGAVATLIIGSMTRQQAPVVVGAVVTVVAALHFAVTLVGPWLVLVPLGGVLLLVGATNESRRRTQDRVRGALVRMR